MDRPYFLNKISALNQQFPAVSLLGPRQVGKMTLARAFAKLNRHQFAAVHFFDLENIEDLQALENPMLALSQLEGLIVIDEIQRKPELFPLLRVLIDTPKATQRWLVLGSASRELIQQSTETLAGRIAYIEIVPFNIVEAHETQRLWLRGGFPNSYLRTSDETSFEWRKQ